MPVDDSFTKALLHFNDSDGSTTFNDESGKTWTAAGNAQIDTSDNKFGTGSGLFDGAGDYITTTDTTDWDIGSGDFTIDFWYRPTALGNYNLCGQGEDTLNLSLWSWYVQQDGVNKIMGVIISGSTQYQALSTGTVVAGNWYHVAVVRNGNDLTTYLNGVGGTPKNVTGITANNSSEAVSIGRLGSRNALYTNGRIDEFRFSKGIARWTANFTPPTQEYAYYPLQQFWFT